ncbi:hypothetical protein OCS_01941 [Ophiocordyceps sinensis CO18]|uniref:Uncharacterized protein n=1 Tax=Ophiocordyceps sinensis (strain Co18 / CGMCC 3.14243) TaxID=911162 RepID=T5AIV7_OPHSC|nr:hypothetical protein OCS_01941 [Ophiocordyceps sinensis CO18]
MIPSIWLPSTLPKARRRGLVYFICGNPGCIGFYADFLEALRGMLDSSEAHTAYDIYGRNLLGFSDAEHEPFVSGSGRGPWDVGGQVEAVMADVVARAGGQGHPEGEQAQAYDLVILTGHSIAITWIAQVFAAVAEDRMHVGALYFAAFLHTAVFVSLLISLLEQFALPPKPDLARQLHDMDRDGNSSVQRGENRSSAEESDRHAQEDVEEDDDAEAPTETTPLRGGESEWLKSRDGVRQALHMGISELDCVGEDGWNEELWAAATAEDVGPGNDDGHVQTPRFFFFYGKNDGWVADHVRDEFVRRRMAHGERGGRTSIVVDEGNLPHAFCTTEHNSWAVAKRVHGWLQEIEGGVKT